MSAILYQAHVYSFDFHSFKKYSRFLKILTVELLKRVQCFFQAIQFKYIDHRILHQIFFKDLEPMLCNINLTLAAFWASCIFEILQGIWTASSLVGFSLSKVTFISFAQLGKRWPVQGEKVNCGGGSQVNRMMSFSEWLVSVNDWWLATQRAQSPKLMWLFLGTEKKIIINIIIIIRPDQFRKIICMILSGTDKKSSDHLLWS